RLLPLHLFSLHHPTPPATSPLSHTTLFRSRRLHHRRARRLVRRRHRRRSPQRGGRVTPGGARTPRRPRPRTGRDRLSAAPVRTGDRKSTRLNSSHDQISYAVFCLKKKNKKT